MSDEEGSAASPAEGELVYWWAPRGDERVFDLVSWPQDALHVVRSLLESAEVEHRWEAGKLVVDAPQRTEVQELLDEVVAASRPRLEADADRVAYELADWPSEELRELEAALDREGIVGEWTEDGELLVYESDEERVDALFEELGLHGPDDRIELEGEELTDLLNDVLLATDGLARDAAGPRRGRRHRQRRPSGSRGRPAARLRRTRLGDSCPPSWPSSAMCSSATTPRRTTRR